MAECQLPKLNVEGSIPFSRSPCQLSDNIIIALLSCCVLIFQIAVTRILSVVLWYHFAFLSISLAMLGLGLPGVWFSLHKPGGKALSRSLLIASISLPVSVAIIIKGAAWMPRGGSDSAFIVTTLTAIAVPMVALGSGICLMLLNATGWRIGRAYGFNLFGAVLGALLTIPLMSVVATPLLLAGLGLVPLSILSCYRGNTRRVGFLLGIVLLGAMVWGWPFKVTRSKLYPEKEMGVLYEKWTPTGRITVLQKCPFKNDQLVPWGWGFGSRFSPIATEQLWIDQDGSAGMPVEHPGGNLEGVEHLLFDVTSVGYQLRAPKRVAIIGAGGGRDILTALKTGANEVDAVEVNGAIVQALTGQFREFSGDVYNMPGVNAVISEGRSYMTRATASYDLIQLSLVDSWAATAAGAYALSENYLYTLEAFKLYFDRLTDDGLISVTRFISGRQQMEGARLAVLVMAALRRLGVEHPERHIAVINGGLTGTFLVKKNPFSAEDVSRLKSIAYQYGFKLLWPQRKDIERSIVSQVITDGPAFLIEKGYDMSPPHDNRPFFFNSASMFGSGSITADGAVGFNEFAIVMLRRIVIGVGLGSMLFFMLPFLFTGSFERKSGFWSGSVYFATTGFAFMLVEFPWIQQYILYLGHPSYAVAAVLGALLFGAGLGSTYVGRLAGISRAVRMMPLIPIAVISVQLSLGPIIDNFIASSLVFRCFSGCLLLVPAGFLMGLSFPLGMIIYGDANKPWFWAVNGISSVVASVISLALAMTFGFSIVVMIAAVLYVIAILVLITGRMRLRTRTQFD